MSRPADERTGATVDAASSLSSRRPLVVLLAGLVPWLVIPYDGGVSLVLSVALANPETLSFTTVFDYVFVHTRGVPPALLAWPIATLLYLCGAGSAALARIDREDRRVTAGLFALAGLDVCYAAFGFSSFRAGVVAFPLGAAFLWLAAWASRP